MKLANDKFRTFAKGVGLAVDIVEHEPAIERAIHHACGSALICDSMDIRKECLLQEVKGIYYELHIKVSINSLFPISGHVGRNCDS